MVLLQISPEILRMSSNRKMLGSKGILTPLIPDCYVLCTPAIFKNIRNSLMFLRKWIPAYVFGGANQMRQNAAFAEGQKATSRWGSE